MVIQVSNRIKELLEVRRTEKLVIGLGADLEPFTAHNFKGLAQFVDNVRAKCKVEEQDIPVELRFDPETATVELTVRLSEDWNEKKYAFLDMPVSNGTLALLDTEALAQKGFEPKLGFEGLELYLGVRPTHAHTYGRVNDDGNVVIPGYGVYSPDIFKVIRLLGEADGYFKEDQ